MPLASAAELVCEALVEAVEVKPALEARVTSVALTVFDCELRWTYDGA